MAKMKATQPNDGLRYPGQRMTIHYGELDFQQSDANRSGRFMRHGQAMT